MDIESSTPPAEIATPEPSLAEHEAEFSPAAVESREATADPIPDPAASTAATDARDDKGRFRHRAKSQQAGPDDVAKITEYTKRYRDAEEAAALGLTQDANESPRVFELRKRAALAEALRDAKAASAPRAQQPQAQAPPPRPAPTALVKPNPEDPKYVYGMADPAFLEDLSDWKVETKLQARDQQHQERTAEWTRGQSFAKKVDAAKAAYPDFQKVALDPPSQIPPGSLIDRYIWDHAGGAHLLYHFQSQPAEIQRVLALSPIDQVDALSLLAQRLTASPVRGLAAPTGSAAAPVVIPGPKPPNPVRQGPMRTGDEPPGEDASIAEHERYYGVARRR